MSSPGDETPLRDARIDGYQIFPSMANSNSPHFSFFGECLQARNPYAIYLESIRRAFKSEELDVAVALLEDVKDVYEHANLLYLLLGYCAGRSDAIAYMELWSGYRVEEIEKMGREVVEHIMAMNPRCLNTYCRTWKCDDVPTCTENHGSGERCLECIFYHLGLEICQMS